MTDRDFDCCKHNQPYNVDRLKLQNVWSDLVITDRKTNPDQGNNKNSVKNDQKIQNL